MKNDKQLSNKMNAYKVVVEVVVVDESSSHRDRRSKHQKRTLKREKKKVRMKRKGENTYFRTHPSDKVSVACEDNIAI